MIVIIPWILFIIAIIATWYVTSKYEYKFEYSFKEALTDLIIKSEAFFVPEEPIQAEHRETPLYYKIELSKLFEKGVQMELAKLMANFIKSSGITFDRLIGLGRKETLSKPTREKYWIVPLLSGIMKKPYALIIEIGDSKEFICEGEVKDNEAVVIIDDVLTTGRSIINATKYLRENYKNIRVAHAFTFIVRFPFNKGGLEGAKSTLRKYGIELHTIIDNVGLVQALHERKYLSSWKLQQVLKDSDLEGSPISFLKNPSLK